MDCSQDIKLEAGGGACYYFKFLPWDTDFFGRKSYVLDDKKSNLKPIKRITSMLSSYFPEAFLTAKIDTNYAKGISDFLQESGFVYIDTEVVLKYNRKFKADNAASSVKVIKLDVNANLPYGALGKTFNFTRFHNDLHITRSKADNLWISYIKNYEPSPSRHMFIAEYNGNVAGSILVNLEDGGKKAYLFFVSVVGEFQKIGIGSCLIRKVVDYFPQSDLFTGTQIRNINALNFYIKNGFSIVAATSNVFHRWS